MCRLFDWVICHFVPCREWVIGISCVRLLSHALVEPTLYHILRSSHCNMTYEHVTSLLKTHMNMLTHYVGGNIPIRKSVFYNQANVFHESTIL
jgi:hypothetical protein